MRKIQGAISLVALAAAITIPAVAQQQATRAQAEQDPVLKAMLAELDRNEKRLQLQNFQKPYFLEYRIDDVVEYHANAEYGALTGEGESHHRIAHVRIRVGDYKLDNSHPPMDGRLARMLGRLGLGDGMIALEATDDDPVGLRYGLWSASDIAYKQALDDYAKKQAELKTVQTPPQADDFAEEKPVVDLEPVEQLALDRAGWKQRIVEASGLFLSDPAVKGFAQEIETSSGSVIGRVRTEYLVNSEGTITRKSTAEYRAEVAFGAQAPDGMALERSAPFSATTAAALPGPAHFHSAGLRTLQGLDALCKAPVMTGEYQGPVLLTGNASAGAFHNLFARAIEARVPALGSTARTTGPFASSYEARVLPESFKVVDDPTLTSFDGKTLAGAYKVDDEGVPAQAVTVVDAGKLTSYLLGRDPIRDFPESNGHGRAGSGQAPHSMIGVLEFEAGDPVADDELEKKLIAMGKDQGLDAVYMIETLGGSTDPRTVDRIKVADGSKEVVRGVRLGDLDLRTLRSDLVAAGDHPYVHNSFGDVPTTVIAPAILIDQLTVKRDDATNEKLPYYPPPAE